MSEQSPDDVTPERQPEGQPAAQPQDQPPSPREVPATFRRAPRVGRFLTLGVLAGLLLGGGLTFGLPGSATTDRGLLLLFLTVTAVVLCTGLAAVIAVIADRRAR